MSYIIEIIFYTLYFRSLNYLKQFLLKFEIHRVEEVGRAVCLNRSQGQVPNSQRIRNSK
jgi:hypothetical protein